MDNGARPVPLSTSGRWQRKAEQERRGSEGHRALPLGPRLDQALPQDAAHQAAQAGRHTHSSTAETEPGERPTQLPGEHPGGKHPLHTEEGLLEEAVSEPDFWEGAGFCGIKNRRSFHVL